MSLADRTKWDAKYALADGAPREPSRVLVELASRLPEMGRGLDVAGGAGRHAIWLAQRGLQMTLADVSPVGLQRAVARAAEAGVTIDTLEVDLEQQPFPPGPWNLILFVCFLGGGNYRRAADHLAPGGKLIIIQPTLRNLERHDRPPRDYLLAEGELPKLVGDLPIEHYAEGWSADNRHDAVLVARRPFEI
jgi:SAM-dependent methyltransferase